MSTKRAQNNTQPCIQGQMGLYAPPHKLTCIVRASYPKAYLVSCCCLRHIDSQSASLPVSCLQTLAVLFCCDPGGQNDSIYQSEHLGLIDTYSCASVWPIVSDMSRARSEIACFYLGRVGVWQGPPKCTSLRIVPRYLPVIGAAACWL